MRTPSRGERRRKCALKPTIAGGGLGSLGTADAADRQQTLPLVPLELVPSR